MPPKVKLSVKQRLFVEAYLVTLNATEAARRAGYRAKNDNVFGAIGAENLRKPKIKALIEQRLKEAAMGADEVLFRLTQQARAPDPTDFISLRDLYDVDKDGDFKLVGKSLDIDLQRVYDLGLGPLIKSISQTGNGIKIEFYDAQRALEMIGKAHGIFREVHEIDGPVSITLDI